MRIPINGKQVAIYDVMKCPLCNYENSRQIEQIQVEQLITAWSQAFNINISQEFQDFQVIKLFKCNYCRLRYFRPDSLTGSDQLYSKLEKFDWYYMPLKWEYNAALEDLKGCRKILEIGCGFGNFIEYAYSQKGLKVDGIEVNESAVKKAQAKGLPVMRMDLKNAAVKFSDYYDGICFFQVLEHVSNPRDFIKWSCDLLKSGGKLLVGVPNANSFLKYQFNLLDMPPHHMTRWSTKALSYLADFFPLQLNEIKIEPLAEYHVVSYVRAYFSAISKYHIFQPFFYPKLQRLSSEIIKQTKIRKLLKGQGLLASYTRI